MSIGNTFSGPGGAVRPIDPDPPAEVIGISNPLGNRGPGTGEQFYLAGRFSRKEEFQSYASKIKLRDSTAEVVSTWLWSEQDSGSQSGDFTFEDAVKFCLQDVRDVLRCTSLLFFSENPLSIPEGESPSLGGKDTELGIGIASTGVRLFCVGPRVNVFHYHPSIVQFNTFDDWLNFEFKGKTY